MQRLEWQNGPALQQAQPATLDELQPLLAPDQAAIVYFIAGDEVLAFLVTQQSTTLVDFLLIIE